MIDFKANNLIWQHRNDISVVTGFPVLLLLFQENTFIGEETEFHYFRLIGFLGDFGDLIWRSNFGDLNWR